jgi:hypothetical protein
MLKRLDALNLTHAEIGKLLAAVGMEMARHDVCAAAALEAPASLADHLTDFADADEDRVLEILGLDEGQRPVAEPISVDDLAALLDVIRLPA